MAERQKIIITDKIAGEAISSGRLINDVLAEHYREEIAERVKANPSAKNVSPIKMALADFGFTGSTQIKDIITTSGAGEWLLPTYIDQRLREKVLGDDMLSYIVSNTTNVDSQAVMTMSLDLTEGKNAKAVEMARVAEGADIPIAKLALGQKSIVLTKKGKAVEATYEALSYMRLDMLAKTLDAIGASVAYYEFGDAIKTLVNGDGNGNALTASMTTGEQGVITQDEILDAIMNFKSATGAQIPVTTIVTGRKFATQLFKMFYSTEAGRGVAGLQFTMPQFANGTINVIYDERVPQIGGKDSIILLNRDFALNKYVANGSNIREMATNIRNQTRLGTISQISGFSKYVNEAAMAIVSK